MTLRRSWAALATLCTALALAAASAAEPTAEAGRDGGNPARPQDGGGPLPVSAHDAGRTAAGLSAEDLEVVENLELLEHLPESDVLDLLLPLRDE